MTHLFRLHYAPDNASLVVRLVLNELGVAYDTQLVDRSTQAHKSAAYRELNPNGLIPVLETAQGPLFETAAILLWLSDTTGRMGPHASSEDRGAYLKWLFFVSNTLHADLRMTFYPETYVGPDKDAQAALQQTLRIRLKGHLSILENVARTQPNWLNPLAPTGLCYYLACLIRWMALYPESSDRSWFNLGATPVLRYFVSLLEDRPAVRSAQEAEGLGPAPFTRPVYANPPEGSAT